MSDSEEYDVKDLEIKSIIAFDGNTLNGFRVHPDNVHVVYPIGNKVAIMNWDTKQQSFLSGHTNVISALDLSRSGKYIASGQINHIGFRASVFIWDFHKKCMLAKHEIHKVRVESVVFSKDDRYVISLGGRDCGSIVVYDVVALDPLCGGTASPLTAGDATQLLPTNRRDQCFISAGDRNMRVWTIDANARTIRSVDVSMSKIKRVIYSIAIDPRDEYVYCGTSTGDVLKVRLNFHHDAEVLVPIKKPMMVGCYGKIDTRPKRSVDTEVILYSSGVRSIYLLFDGRIIIGAGDGTVDLVEEVRDEEAVSISSTVIVPTLAKLRSLRKTFVRAMVTSIQLREKTIFVSTTLSEIYIINLNNFHEVKLCITCHTGPVYDIKFPRGFSDVFATASKNDVRIWSLHTMQELLRIVVANFSCSSLDFAHDGKSLISGWNDGIIRAFTPLSGKIMYAILNAHNKGVSAIAITSDGKRIISGGCEGQVRVWNVLPTKQELLKVLKEHKGPVSAIDINTSDTEAVSSSTDGTCIIWDIIRLCRKQIFIRNTLFTCVKYFPSSVQILTCGSDRKIGYWEVIDGTLIRELEGSISEGLNTLDISVDGSMFLTGGNDQIVKLWKYNDGVTTDIGLGHSGVITVVRFSPNTKYIVSASGSGSIFIWKYPYETAEESAGNIEGSGDTAQETRKLKKASKTDKNLGEKKVSAQEPDVESILDFKITEDKNKKCNCSCVCRTKPRCPRVVRQCKCHEKK